MFAYGQFLTVALTFLISAVLISAVVVYFILVMPISRLLARVSDDHEAGWSFPLVICGAGSRFRVLPMSAPGGIAGEAEDAGELVLDRGGLGEHAVGSGLAAAAVVEQDGLADAGEFGE